MEKIKFRYWCDKNKQYFYFTPWEQKGQEYYEKWEQYTGLKDKNGKEIYEGDIIETNFKKFIKGSIDFYLGEYVLRNCSFVQSLNTLIIYKWKVEIIGNIYENPELLKELKNAKNN